MKGLLDAKLKFALKCNAARFMKLLCLSVILVLSHVVAFAQVVGYNGGQVGYTGVFGGGPLYKHVQSNITEIANSGMTEVIVWSIEVSPTGDLNFNGEFPLTQKGEYIGDRTYPDFAADLAAMKQGTVRRITFSIGSSNLGDWQDVRDLVNAQGTGSGSILYRDFKALKKALPSLDAIDFDDENSYDLSTTVQFSVMLGNLGYHVMPDAFTNNNYWTSLVSQVNNQLQGTVDGVHLQTYAGGTGNSPCVGWNFGGIPVYPGFADQSGSTTPSYSPTQVQTVLTGWHTTCGISGAFMWLYDTFPPGSGLATQYANAIKSATGLL